MTPHIEAKKIDIAPVVLMPGCPLRAKWIAENFLDNVVLINSVRNMFGYTGTYKGKKITVMGSGMGHGSCGIYSWELFSKNYYDVDVIMRVGSCGSYKLDIKVGQVISANTSYGEVAFAKYSGLKDATNIASADVTLSKAAIDIAKKNNINMIETRTYSTDVFYDVRSIDEIINTTGASVVEMESYALFSNAKIHNKKALCLLTCSDNIVDGTKMDSFTRQTTFNAMIKIALDLAINQYPAK